MAKHRKSKRQLIRDEKRAKKRGRDIADHEERSSKRQRRGNDDKVKHYDSNDLFTIDIGPDAAPVHGNPCLPAAAAGHFEREFFGMLADDEQEFFRHADEKLEFNDFPSPEDRREFLQLVYREARGKELKLASSQSCSRIMERLILLSTARQKKRLFAAFAGHFMTLITHRFASHCCEKLFLMSAPVVTEELSGQLEPAEAEDIDAGESPQVAKALDTPMEDLFLLTLDELEEHLAFLLPHRYGSHALRVLLLVLSGRPLDQASTKSLLKGKGKESITVEGASAISSQPRAVPSSFSMAIRKIIADSTASLDPAALRVLAKHPTGNPTLQLQLELELAMSAQSKRAAQPDAEAAVAGPTLLERLVPGAPASFADEKSPACEFVNDTLYDPIGSRLLETLIAHCPGKIFKGLQAHIFGPRIQSLLGNDIASYPAIKVLNRLSKADLAAAAQNALSEVASFVEKGRFNVIKAFFERCHARDAASEIVSLLQALTTACGGHWKHLVPKLCLLNEPTTNSEPEGFQPDAKNKSALVAHGSQVVTALLDIPGHASKAIQTSLLALPAAQLVHLATSSAPTAAILSKALAVPAQVPHFHKMLVAALLPSVHELATSPHGSRIVNAVIATPSKVAEVGDAAASAPVVPFYLKENMMEQLERHAGDLRGSNVWRTWRGDLWSSRRQDWVRWAKTTDPAEARVAAAPRPRGGKEGEKPGKANEKPSGKGKPLKWEANWRVKSGVVGEKNEAEEGGKVKVKEKKQKGEGEKGSVTDTRVGKEKEDKGKEEKEAKKKKRKLEQSDERDKVAEEKEENKKKRKREQSDERHKGKGASNAEGILEGGSGGDERRKKEKKGGKNKAKAEGEHAA